jgi:integrase
MRLFTEHLRDAFGLSLQGAVSDITLEQGESFVGHLQSTRSVETEHLYSRILAHYFEYCVQTGQLAPNASAFSRTLDRLRRPKSHVIPTVPVEYVEQIIEYVQQTHPEQPSDTITERRYLGMLRDRAFLLTLAHSGLRLSEICGLRRQQFSTDTSTILIDAEIDLPLPSVTGNTLATYLRARHTLDRQQRTSDLPLFARHDKRAGIRVLAISRWTGANIVEAWAKLALEPAVRTALDASHQYITPHTFRHYFVMTALRNTENDVATTQLLARHADRSTTRRYIQKLASEHIIAD